MSGKCGAPGCGAEMPWDEGAQTGWLSGSLRRRGKVKVSGARLELCACPKHKVVIVHRHPTLIGLEDGVRYLTTSEIKNACAGCGASYDPSRGNGWGAVDVRRLRGADENDRMRALVCPNCSPGVD